MQERLRTDYGWTRRQSEVLQLIAQRKTNPEIADALGLSLAGAKWHVAEILSKLQADSREEAAEYWRHHNGLRPRFGRIFRGAATASLVKWAAVSAGAVFVSLAGLAALLQLNSEDGKSGASAPTTQPTFAATLDAYNVALFPYQDDQKVEVIDSGTGRIIARMPVAGIAPDALQRRTAAELLVTDDRQDAARPGSVLSVYALDGGFTLKYSAELPKMLRYGLFSHSIALSRNERYLYYIAHGRGQDVVGCQAGGPGSPTQCDVFQIGVFDLRARTLVGFTDALPTGCGAPVLLAAASDAAVSACPSTGDVIVIGSDARIASAETFASEIANHPDAGRSRGSMTVFGGFRQAEGGMGVLLESGTYVVRKSGGQIVSGRFLPEGRAMVRNGLFSQADGTLLVGFRDASVGPMSPLLGSSVFDPNTLTIAASQIFGPAQSMAPISTGGVAVLRQGGDQQRLTADGRQTTQVSNPSWASTENNEWFLVP